MTTTRNQRLAMDQLAGRFPRSAERFRASRFWHPSKEGDIAQGLVQFLDEQGFGIICIWVFDKADPQPKDSIGFEPVVNIKGRNVDIGGRWFKDLEQARLHALDYVLDIFETEQKITA